LEIIAAYDGWATREMERSQMTHPIDWSNYAEIYHEYSSGVYGIVNLTRNRVYVGVTSGHFRDQWSYHRHRLEAGIHDVGALQRDWTLDGPHTFAFLVFQELPSTDEKLFIYRQFWMESLRARGVSCYNTRGRGCGN
jgi:hypothetical protein